MWEYTDKVRQYFLNPKNAGEMEDATAVGEVGSLACGDALKLFLKINDEGIIENASFQTFGCASAIASSSALTEMLKGRTVEEAEKLTNKDIADFLGGLPREKMHCSVMGQEALEAAIACYRGETVELVEMQGNLVCHCFGVTDETVRHAIRANDLKSLEDITHFTKAGGGCEQCLPRLEEILSEEQGKTPLKPLEIKPMSNIERMQRIMKVIEEEIRPQLQKDGGDIELLDVDGKDVYVSLRGACTDCPSSVVTLNDFVQKVLCEQVDTGLRVREKKQ